MPRTRIRGIGNYLMCRLRTLHTPKMWPAFRCAARRLYEGPMPLGPLASRLSPIAWLFPWEADAIG